MRSQLTDAFEESLATAPDPAEVLSGVRAGIEGRRRRQRYYRTGGVLAAVVLVVTASSVAATVIRDRTGAPAPAGAGDAIPVGEWKSTLHIGWLPEGLGPPVITSTEYEERRVYPATATPETRNGLRVSIYQAGMRPDIGGPPVDVNGRQGYETSGPTQARIFFPLPSGRWVNVEFSLGKAGGLDGQPELRETALRIARSIDQNGNAVLRTAFAPSYLPVGQRIIGVSTDMGSPTVFGRIHTDNAPDSLPRVWTGNAVVISVEENQSGLLEQAERIADIQGRPAYRNDNEGDQVIVVTDFHAGVLTVASAAGRASVVPEAELIKIAEGVRWLG